MTHLHLEDSAAGSLVTVFCPPVPVSTTELLDTLHDTDEITSGFPAATDTMTKLSGTDLVDVRGNLEFADKLASAAFTSPSSTGVSVALEKLLSQLSRLSTTSVCEPDAPDSGVSI